jgi:cold shock CspA family protein
VTGELKFYDARSGWGVIKGDDTRLYAVTQANVAERPLRVGDRVNFEPRPMAGGPQATAVRRQSA